MAKTVDQYFDDLRGTRVWRSVFRSGTRFEHAKARAGDSAECLSALVLNQGADAHAQFQRDLVPGHADARAPS